MNSNIASSYNLPPDPGGEFYVNIKFSVILHTIYTTCFNTILHFVHRGFGIFHRILTKRSNFFSKTVVLCNRAQVSFVRQELSLCVLYRLVCVCCID
jgi:hypothetical protein